MFVLICQSSLLSSYSTNNPTITNFFAYIKLIFTTATLNEIRSNLPCISVSVIILLKSFRPKSIHDAFILTCKLPLKTFSKTKFIKILQWSSTQRAPTGRKSPFVNNETIAGVLVAQMHRQRRLRYKVTHKMMRVL